MRTARHNGTTTARIRIAGSSHRISRTISKPYAVYDCLLFSTCPISRLFTKRYSMITINRQFGLRAFIYCTKLCRIIYNVTTSFITPICIIFIISTFKNYAIRNNIAITLWIILVRKRIGMVNKSCSTHTVTCNLDNNFIRRMFFFILTGSIQYCLQFHRASRILGRIATSVSGSVLSYIIKSIIIRFYIILIITFVSSNVYRTIFNTIGIIHIR